MKKVLFLLLLVLFRSGCSNADRRESLSTVIKKSISENENDRKVSNDDSRVETVFHVAAVVSSAADDESWIFKDYKLLPGIRAGYLKSLYSGHDISDISAVGVYYILKDKTCRYEAGLGFFGGTYGFKDSFQYKDSIENDGIYGVDANLKIPVSRLGDNSKLYISGGVSWGVLEWSYKNPLYDSDGFVIDDDNVQFYRGYIGPGVEYYTDYASINFEIIPEMFLTDFDTRGGFRNDVFKNHIGLGAKIEAAFVF